MRPKRTLGNADPPADATVICLRVRNSRNCAVACYLEPWGEEYSMEPGEALEFVFRGPSGDGPEIEDQDNSITVYGWSGSTAQVFQGTLGPWRATRPSITDILREELGRVEEAAVRGLGHVKLSDAEAALLAEADLSLDQDLLAGEAAQKSTLVCAALVAPILTRHWQDDPRSRRALWRICARIVMMAGLRLELSSTAVDELFTAARADEAGVTAYVWLHDHAHAATPPSGRQSPTRQPSQTSG